MILRLLELWTVSAGILVAVWYILLSNTTGGVFLTVFTLIYLLLSWYLEVGHNEKSSKSNDRSVGLWCSLLLPLVQMLSYRQDDHFLPLTVAVVFVQYTWIKTSRSLAVKSITTTLLLIQVVVSLLFGSAVFLPIFTLIFIALYSAMQTHLSQSFTVGEGTIVSQLLTYFGFKVTLAAVQQYQGQHIDILDKTTAVIYVSVSVAIILFLYVKSNRQTGWSFYAVFGLVGIVAVLPAVLFLIKFDGMKIILQIMFKNKKSILLFFWWIACTVISVYIVIFYGKKSFTTSSSETYTIEQQDLSENKQNPKSSMEASSSPASSDTLATMIFTAMQEEENSTCRLRTGETNSDKEYFEVKQEKERVGMPSHSEDFHSKSSVQGTRRSRYMYVTTRVRKLFHLVMIAVYIPGLMCNISMLYLASVVTLAVLVILEVIRLYKVPPFGPLLDEYFTVFLDRQDSGDLILTPLYLLVGCSLPLWLSHTNNGHADLKIYAGIVSTGVGDSAASLVGQQLGKHRWPGSRKTVEGTLGAVMFQVIAVLVLQILGVPGSSLSIVTVISVILTSFLEAFSGHIDNLVVSLFAFMLLSTTGTFI